MSGGLGYIDWGVLIRDAARDPANHLHFRRIEADHHGDDGWRGQRMMLEWLLGPIDTARPHAVDAAVA